MSEDLHNDEKLKGIITYSSSLIVENITLVFSSIADKEI